MSKKPPVIMWFRQDLRITDNPALTEAIETGSPLLPIYILDDENAGEYRPGGASRWWLHNSLQSLNASLDGNLQCFRGKADEILPALVRRLGSTNIYWNRCYEPWRIQRDLQIKADLRNSGHHVSSFNGSLLFEPHDVAKADGTPYKVFTPFYRKGCLGNAPPPRLPLAPPVIKSYEQSSPGSSIDDLELMPAVTWYDGIAAAWTPGEDGAQERLDTFLESGIRNYIDGRNRPDLESVSRLSPHLHFGEISPQQVWHVASAACNMAALESQLDHFLSELGWREFSHHLLFHWPDLPKNNLQAKFDRFPWRDDEDALHRWKHGMTGFPIVDAGMRELWETGYMHNRVRMIVGSFLVKNLMLHWHHGERWFWDTLLDADLANNSASWQWIAGCGADAAPYFRIFNPVTQGNKFDPDGVYVRRFVPELAALPNRYLHSPWDAPDDICESTGFVPGQTYPNPVVDLKASRERALDAFRSLKELAMA